MFSILVQATVQQFWDISKDLSLANGPLMLKGSIGEDLEHLEKDRAIKTDPEDSRKRRTIRLFKKNESWGFTIQTYGVQNKKTKEIDVMTYVDYVDYNGAAWLAGLQRGDIFLSINGEPVEGATHQQLVSRIKNVGDSMRCVVLFEDCCRKVELYERFIKLKQVLSAKLMQLQDLKIKENAVMKACGIQRVEEIRLSTRSTKSSISSEWDRYSILGNSVSLSNIPLHIRGRHKLMAVNDSLSDISFDTSINDSLSDNESLASSLPNVSDIAQHKKLNDNIDNVSEYSLPLQTHFQLGGKLLRFSEDDNGSVASSDSLAQPDNIPIKTGSIQIVTKCDIHVSAETSDATNENQANCDNDFENSSSTAQYENGVLINKEDELTKL